MDPSSPWLIPLREMAGLGTGLIGGKAQRLAQLAKVVGYTVADIVAKAVFGVLIFAIALRKSEQEPVAQAA